MLNTSGWTRRVEMREAHHPRAGVVSPRALMVTIHKMSIKQNRAGTASGPEADMRRAFNVQVPNQRKKNACEGRSGTVRVRDEPRGVSHGPAAVYLHALVEPFGNIIPGGFVRVTVFNVQVISGSLNGSGVP